MNHLLQNQALIVTALLVVSVTAFVSWVAVGRLITILIDQNVVDNENDRSMHKGVVPRGGGLVIVASLILATLFWAATSDRPLFFLSLGIVLSAWAGLSWSDDKLNLSPQSRGVVQLILAIVSVFLFGWVDQIGTYELGAFGAFISVIGIVWIANLNNFMDGMDGLAASQAIIASITLGTWFFFLGDTELAAVCFVVAASSYGFLLWNWHPANIFMGDVGSVTLGAFYGCLIVIASDRHAIPVLSLMLVFSVFIFDATYTVLKRIINGERFWRPHRSHWYQRAGLASIPHNRIVLIAILMMCLSSVFASVSLLNPSLMGVLLLLTFAMLVSACFVILRAEKSSKQNNTDNSHP